MALMFCPECQAKVSDLATSCPHCGYPLKTSSAGAAMHASTPEAKGFLAENPHYGSNTEHARDGTPVGPPVIKTAKSRGIYIILGLFFGFLGVHNFYAGHFGRGVGQFLTVAILGWFVIGFVIVFFWILVELFVITKDGAGDLMA